MHNTNEMHNVTNNRMQLMHNNEIYLYAMGLHEITNEMQE